MNNTSVSLASENYAGVHPALLNAIIEANTGHQKSYGGDAYAGAAIDKIRAQFGRQAQVHFVFNGTGANVFALSTMTRSFNAILCSDLAHVYVNESTAVEAFTGCRLLPVATKDGKMLPQALQAAITQIGNMHYPQAKVVTITQPTEYGTVYTREELQQLVSIARENQLYVHIDGARLFNAAAALQCSLAEAVEGADIVSLGGTKAGMLTGEAVIFLNEGLYKDSEYLLKRSMQLSSKMRFISCQFEAILNNDLWQELATYTNNMAKLLAARLSKFAPVTITQPVDTNAVFATMPAEWIAPLQAVLPFYEWDETIHEVRLMCAWDLQEADIDLFIQKLEQLAA